MGLPYNPRILIVTRKTDLGELRHRFATKAQAAFVLERAEEQLELAALEMDALGDVDAAAVRRKAKSAQAGKYRSYAAEEDAYTQTLAKLLQRLEVFDMPVQVVDRGYLPTFRFYPHDIIITFGQDGLVANAAKYATELPIIGVNPDPKRIDGILLPFTPETAASAVRRVLDGRAKMRQVALAAVQLSDGQRMLAFNDLFIGHKSHQSARYQISTRKTSETQCSSGVLISTGAGSTGWLSSMFNMARGIGRFLGSSVENAPRFSPDDRRLVFVVREPFASKRSQADLVAGVIEDGAELIVESLMPQEGVIFSDGIEADYLAFNSGTIATIRVAREQASLVIA